MDLPENGRLKTPGLSVIAPASDGKERACIYLSERPETPVCLPGKVEIPTIHDPRQKTTGIFNLSLFHKTSSLTFSHLTS